MNTYICRYCRQPSDPSSTDLPAVRGAGRHQVRGQRLGLGRAAADQGHGPDPVRPVARPDRGHHASRSRSSTSRRRTGSTSRTTCCCGPTRRPGWRTCRCAAGGTARWPGMPLVMVEAQRPGHIALSDNHAGEVVALPLQHGQPMWVREHRFLCATGNINYDWDFTGVWYETGSGDDREMHYPMGQFGDTFTASGGPGLHAAARPGQHVHPRPEARRVDAHPAELAAVPGPLRADAPAPRVPAQPGLRVLEHQPELPQHLGPAHRARPGRHPVGLRAGVRGRVHHQPLLRDPSGTGRQHVLSRQSCASAARDRFAFPGRAISRPRYRAALSG